jgi:hypothetical protein
MTTTFDSHKNLAYSAVATAPSPATTGTSLVVTAGDGAKFPAAPFNATVWPGGGATASQANAEIVRVTGISVDTLTIVRGQEATTAQSIAVGYQISLGVTLKTLMDIEAAINATLGGSLSGTLPNPAIAAGAVGTTQLAVGAVTQNGFGTAGSTLNTTSATYVDLDATNAAVTLATTGGDLLAWFCGDVQANTTLNDVISVALSLDGATEVGAVAQSQTGAVGFGKPVALVWRFTGVAAGSHTVKVRWHGQTGGNSYSATNRGLLVAELKR